MTTETIERFMDGEYSINTSQKSIRILVGAGFLELQDMGEQYQNCNKVQGRIKSHGLDKLVAKVFSLAYPYDFLLTKENNNLVRWSGWLGTAEYRLGVVVEDTRIKKKLFERGLEHLLESKKRGNDSKENASYIGNCYSKLEIYEEALPFLLESREKGDNSKENASYIGNCHFKLKRYEEALPFFLESREKGNNSKENTSYIGNCYFRLRKYGQGISEYEKALEITKQEDFNHDWVHTFDHILEDSFDLLTKLQSSIQTPIYRDLLQRFEALYNDFVDYGENNGQERKICFKLRHYNRQPSDRIGDALAEVS